MLANLDAAVSFGVTLPALLVAHNVADHWAQSGHQACNKGRPGWPGRRACAAHVAGYTLVTALTVGLAWIVFRLPIGPVGFVAGQLVSAVTHYWADRRSTLARLARLLGKGEFYALGAPRRVFARPHVGDEVVLWDADTCEEVPWDNPSLGTGAYALDQAWHWFWLLVAAFVTVVA